MKCFLCDKEIMNLIYCGLCKEMHEYCEECLEWHKKYNPDTEWRNLRIYLFWKKKYQIELKKDDDYNGFKESF